jgi:hypothetical protein
MKKNSKHEIQNPKQYRSPNDKTRSKRRLSI